LTTPPRKTRFRLAANLRRTGFPPAGLLQKVSELRSFLYVISSPFSRFGLAHTSHTLRLAVRSVDPGLRPHALFSRHGAAFRTSKILEIYLPLTS
ncbi:MAG TPA: hypothetical protein VLF66_01985, partial [Thermoanaerobaculia bacterium]|nr:hypothetical protein [Thermoanaerobaculia bacterium]